MMHNVMRQWLSDPSRISALTQAIRAKVPANDVEDVVQSTLADALVSADPPTEEGAFDRWLFGIARHKIADYYRRNRRDVLVDSDTVATSGHAEATPESARDLLRWVDQELPKEPEATRTLEWMMREASGDRLETIAQEHALSAPAVRQRVSRLRRYLRERWALELAAALGLLIVVTGIFAYRHGHIQPPIGPDIAHVEPTPAARAQTIREAALTACKAGEWKPCLIELDRAKELDPAGDSAPEIQQARVGAARALAPTPSPSASGVPSDASVESPDSIPSAVPRPVAPKKAEKMLAPKAPPPKKAMWSKGEESMSMPTQKATLLPSKETKEPPAKMAPNQNQATQVQAKKGADKQDMDLSASKHKSKNVDIDLDEGPAQKHPAKFKK